MRVIEPAQFRKSLKKKRPLRILLPFLLILLIASYGVLAYAEALPNIVGQPATLSAPTAAAPSLKWPGSGQAALGAVGYGIVAESGAQTTAPMASIAKVITALTVLQAKPLKIGEQGPLLRIGEADIQAYDDYVALGGSVVPVNIDETISEYQALQAMLLPSANNMADTLGRWAYGSVDAFLAHANRLAASLQLSQTHMADAGGLSASTKSTPHDLVMLGLAALRSPVLSEIVAQKTATIPVAGKIDNVNGLLGQNGVNGIKTGNTDEAGGCLLFSSVQAFSNGQPLILVGAIMGDTSLGAAARDSLALINSSLPGFRVITALKRHAVVGNYSTPWDSSASAIVSSDINLPVWSNQPPHYQVNLQPVAWSVNKGSMVGSVSVTSGGVTQTVPIVLRDNLAAPTLGWRLSHVLKR